MGCWSRIAWRCAEQMKNFGMTYRYIEVARGDHMTIAWKNLPAVFEFLDGHKRGERDNEKSQAHSVNSQFPSDRRRETAATSLSRFSRFDGEHCGNGNILQIAWQFACGKFRPTWPRFHRRGNSTGTRQV